MDGLGVACAFRLGGRAASSAWARRSSAHIIIPALDGRILAGGGRHLGHGGAAKRRREQPHWLAGRPEVGARAQLDVNCFSMFPLRARPPLSARAAGQVQQLALIGHSFAGHSAARLGAGHFRPAIETTSAPRSLSECQRSLAANNGANY